MPVPISSCSFARRCETITNATAKVLSESLVFVREEYDRLALFESAMIFCQYDLAEAPAASTENLRRVGLFPWVEASEEFDMSITLAMQGYYKATIDHIRRGLELVLVGIYFTSTVGTETQAREWVKSQRTTPFFSKVLQHLGNLPRHADLDCSTHWFSKLRAFYYSLCDTVHAKGVAVSYNSFQPSHVHLNGTSFSTFFASSMKKTMDAYIDAVRYCATALALSNPILLVGLPLDDKFGLNPPIGGYYNEAQSERLRSLLLEGTEGYFSRLAESEEVLETVRWVQNMPDLSSEQFTIQKRELFDSFAGPATSVADGEA